MSPTGQKASNVTEMERDNRIQYSMLIRRIPARAHSNIERKGTFMRRFFVQLSGTLSKTVNHVHVINVGFGQHMRHERG